MAKKRQPRKKPVAHVRAREFAHLAVQLVKRRGLGLYLMALPFGMAYVWLEQALLQLQPAMIRDMRVVAIVSVYGSSVIGYLANAVLASFAYAKAENLVGVERSGAPFQWGRLLSLGMVALLAPLGCIAGLAVAVVPGVVIWLSWVLAAPAVAISGKGAFAAIRYSARLTWGSRWALLYCFGFVEVLVIGLSCAVAVASGGSAASLLQDARPLSPGEALVNGLIESLQAALFGALCCVAYARLHGAHQKMAARTDLY
jgi:hypothetical protein